MTELAHVRPVTIESMTYQELRALQGRALGVRERLLARMEGGEISRPVPQVIDRGFHALIRLSGRIIGEINVRELAFSKAMKVQNHE